MLDGKIWSYHAKRNFQRWWTQKSETLIEDNQEKCLPFYHRFGWYKSLNVRIHQRYLSGYFHCLCFPRTIWELWNLRQKPEKKSIKIFQWLIRKHAFCWQSLCCCLFVHLHKSWYENAIEFNGFRSAAAWENVVLSLCCADVVVYVALQAFIIFIQAVFFAQ